MEMVAKGEGDGCRAGPFYRGSSRPGRKMEAKLGVNEGG